jgi:hypothetical protein
MLASFEFCGAMAVATMSSEFDSLCQSSFVCGQDTNSVLNSPETGGITPEGVEVSPDGRTVYVANLQTEDISFLAVDTNGNLTRQGYLAVGVTGATPDPIKGGNGSNLFATDEEVGLRWFFSSAYADDPPILGKTTTGFDPQKSCGFCHWDGRQDGCQWNVAANAIGGVKVCPQNAAIPASWLCPHLARSVTHARLTLAATR